MRLSLVLHGTKEKPWVMKQFPNGRDYGTEADKSAVKVSPLEYSLLHTPATPVQL